MLISKTKIRLYALSIMTSLSFMYGCTTTPSATTPTANSSIKNLKAMAMAFRSEPGLSEFVKNLGIPVSGRFQCGCILDLYKSNYA